MSVSVWVRTYGRGSSDSVYETSCKPDSREGIPFDVPQGLAESKRNISSTSLQSTIIIDADLLRLDLTEVGPESIWSG